jgi:hypothetical protein
MLSYYGLVAVTLPCLGAAVAVGIVESLLGDDGRWALCVASPFLRAVERDGRTPRRKR